MKSNVLAAALAAALGGAVLGSPAVFAAGVSRSSTNSPAPCVLSLLATAETAQRNIPVCSDTLVAASDVAPESVVAVAASPQELAPVAAAPAATSPPTSKSFAVKSAVVTPQVIPADPAIPVAANNSSGDPQPSATGANTLAVGYGAVASGDNSIAMGNYATATGGDSIAIGEGSSGGGQSSVAVGNAALADGFNAAAFGNTAHALGSYSVALGTGSNATGAQGVAVGTNTAASGTSSTAVGYGANAAGDYDVAIGSNSRSLGPGNAGPGLAFGTVAIGNNSFVNPNSVAGVALGDSAAVSNASGVALGGRSTAGGENAVAVGYLSSAGGADSVAIGLLATAQADNSVAIGMNSNAGLGVNDGVAYNPGTTALAGTNTGEVSIGANGSERVLTNVAPGSRSTDAVNVSQLQSLAAVADNAVQYDNPGHTSVTLGGAGATAPVALTNLAPGALASNSSDAVNGSQLYATNQQVATNTTNIATNTTNITGLQQDALQWNNTLGAYDASHGTAAPQKISNVAAGTAITDAVNVGQLNTVSGVASNAVQYDNPGHTSVTLGGAGATAPVALTNLAPGALASNSSDAVNGSQLYATNQQVATNTTNIATNTTNITGLQQDALQWNNTLGAYDASHGTAAAQKISNVAAGTAGTDAVNVSQLDAVASAGDNAVQYDDATHNSVTLGGTSATSTVELHNVAAGTVATDALNVSQLYPVATIFGGGTAFLNGAWTSPMYAIQGNNYNNVGDALHAVDFNLSNIYNEIANFPPGPVGPPGPPGPPGSGGGVAQNAVLYDNTGQTSVTLGGVGATTPVGLHNVAAGVAGTDAVNVNQLDAGVTQAINTANAYTDSSSRNAINTANAYTDQKFAGINDRLNQEDQKISATCAMGTAMSQMGEAGAGADEYGRVSAGVGVCSGGASAVSAGFSEKISDRAHLNFGAAFSQGMGTVGAGVGFDLH